MIEAFINQAGLALQRRRVEEALRKANIYYRSLIETSLDPLVTIGLDGKIIDANRATETATGYPRQDLIGKDFSNYFTEPEKAQAGLRRVLEEGLVRDYLLELCHKDGRAMSVLCNASIYRDEAGKVIGVFAAARDITERKRAEDKLIKSEAKFRILAEKSPSMIFINKMGKIVYANNKCEEITGYTHYDLYSPDFYFISLIAPEYVELEKLNLEKHKRGEEVEPCEYVMVTKDGKRIMVIMNTALIDYEGAKAILGVITDITERKQTEEELKKRLAEMEVYNTAAVGRELKMIELEKELARLKKDKEGKNES